MARSIKETPVLQGKSAVTFRAEMKKSETKKVTQDQRKKIADDYDKVLKMVAF